MVEDSTIETYAREHPTEGRIRISCALGVTQRRVRTVLHRAGIVKPQHLPANGTKPAASAKRALTGALDAGAFIAQFDAVALLRSTLPELAGKVITDSDLRTSLGIDALRWSRVRQLPEFEPYQMRVRDRQIWAMPATLEELRRKLDVL